MVNKEYVHILKHFYHRLITTNIYGSCVSFSSRVPSEWCSSHLVACNQTGFSFTFTAACVSCTKYGPFHLEEKDSLFIAHTQTWSPGFNGCIFPSAGGTCACLNFFLIDFTSFHTWLEHIFRIFLHSIPGLSSQETSGVGFLLSLVVPSISREVLAPCFYFSDLSGHTSLRA